MFGTGLMGTWLGVFFGAGHRKKDRGSLCLPVREIRNVVPPHLLQPLLRMPRHSAGRGTHADRRAAGLQSQDRATAAKGCLRRRGDVDVDGGRGRVRVR